jgi:tRNA (adenine57-N1/adenine58-N1)-methyltransferase
VTLLTELRRQDFAFIDVCEIMLRFYKADPEHFRPTDRMVAHTGYLIFARPVIIDHEKDNQELLNEVAEVAGED